MISLFRKLDEHLEQWLACPRNVQRAVRRLDAFTNYSVILAALALAFAIAKALVADIVNVR